MFTISRNRARLDTEMLLEESQRGRISSGVANPLSYQKGLGNKNADLGAQENCHVTVIGVDFRKSFSDSRVREEWARTSDQDTYTRTIRSATNERIEPCFGSGISSFPYSVHPWFKPN
jgi:hypothetical protein